jgi:hypothetical protein
MKAFELQPLRKECFAPEESVMQLVLTLTLNPALFLAQPPVEPSIDQQLASFTLDAQFADDVFQHPATKSA